MMSAPSDASVTAWLRPWPRAAPVMNATLPSTRPTGTAFRSAPRWLACHCERSVGAGKDGVEPLSSRPRDNENVHIGDLVCGLIAACPGDPADVSMRLPDGHGRGRLARIPLPAGRAAALAD